MSTLNDFVHLTPPSIPPMNPPLVYYYTDGRQLLVRLRRQLPHKRAREKSPGHAYLFNI